jgi:hypothetical protein
VFSGITTRTVYQTTAIQPLDTQLSFHGNPVPIYQRLFYHIFFYFTKVYPFWKQVFIEQGFFIL